VRAWARDVRPGRRKGNITRLRHCKKQQVCVIYNYGRPSAKRSRNEIEELLSAVMNTANEQRKQAVADSWKSLRQCPTIRLLRNPPHRDAGAARSRRFAEYQIASRFMDSLSAHCAGGFEVKPPGAWCEINSRVGAVISSSNLAFSGLQRAPREHSSFS